MEKDWINRVTKEVTKLDKKLNKLVDFINSDKFEVIDETMQSYLEIQATAMATYSNVLHARLEHME